MKKFFLILPLLLGAGLAKTNVPPALKYQTGSVSLLGGKVTVQASPALRYLDAAGARTVIVDLWGNRPEAADDVLGMLVPGPAAVNSKDGWGIVLTENTDGHVSDADAARTDYTQLLKDMQASTEKRNAARIKEGYEPIKLIGWAEPPSYDAAAHKMIWARELAFGDSGQHTLNYAVRVLGRDDVLELNAVGSVTQLPLIRQGMQGVLPQVTFTAGYRYQDYREGNDRLAAYGVAGLVAGGLAAKKLGLLALLPLLLKKGGFLIVVLLGAFARFAGFFRRLFGRRTVQPGPAPTRPPSSPPPLQPPVHPDLAHRQNRVNLSKPGDRVLGRHSDSE